MNASSERERRLVRQARASEPAPGLTQPGHTAMEVVRADALAQTDPFVPLMDGRLDFEPGPPGGETHPHAGLDTATLNHRGILRIFLLGLSLAGLAACGGGETPAPAGGENDPAAAAPAVPHACELLPAAEVAAVLGEPVNETLALSTPGPDGAVSLSQCNYAAGGNPAAASFLLRRFAAGETIAAAAASVRQTLVESGIGVEDVPGLGETAFWGSNQLHVFTEGWYLIVSPTVAGGLEQGRRLVERALAGL